MSTPLPLPEVKYVDRTDDPWVQLLQASVMDEATFERMWIQCPEPARECVVYDWPETETP